MQALLVCTPAGAGHCAAPRHGQGPQFGILPGILNSERFGATSDSQQNCLCRTGGEGSLAIRSVGGHPQTESTLAVHRGRTGGAGGDRGNHSRQAIHRDRANSGPARIRCRPEVLHFFHADLRRQLARRHHGKRHGYGPESDPDHDRCQEAQTAGQSKRFSTATTYIRTSPVRAEDPGAAWRYQQSVGPDRHRQDLSEAPHGRTRSPNQFDSDRVSRADLPSFRKTLST